MASLEFFHTKLKNGLTVIGEYRPSAVSIAVGFFVRAGARDEVTKLSGVSHFLEHMVFKGTEKRSALDITYQLSSLGAQSNAYTTEENTVYYLAVLPEYFESAFEVLSDMMRPALDPGEFTTEKKVILEEIALYRDRPTHVLYEAALREFFGRHSAGNCVLGTTDSISALSVEEMRGYFSERYSASNIVLTVAGNFDWKRVVDLAEKYCSGWPSQEVHREIVPFAAASGQIELRRDNLQLGHVCLLAPGPSATSRERYDLQVLSCLVGDASGSRVYWELIDRGIADTAYIDNDEMDETGVTIAYASALPEKMAEVEEILRDILSTPLKFSDVELARAITKLRTRVVLQGESSMRRLMAVGLDWVYRRAYASLQEELALLKEVTRETIEAAAAKFPLAPTTAARLMPA